MSDIAGRLREAAEKLNHYREIVTLAAENVAPMAASSHDHIVKCLDQFAVVYVVTLYGKSDARVDPIKGAGLLRTGGTLTFNAIFVADDVEAAMWRHALGEETVAPVMPTLRLATIDGAAVAS